MRFHIHSAALVAVLTAALPFHALHASAGKDSASLDVRYLRLSELADAIGSTAATPSGWRTPAALKGLPLTDAADRDDPVVAWVPAAALARPGARAEALEIVSAGVPMLVTAQAGEPRFESSVFGMGAKRATVLYQPLGDGSLHLHLFDDSDDPATRHLIAERVAEDVASRARAARESTKPPSRRARRAIPAPSPATADSVPMRKWSASSIGANGSRMAFTATVIRDASARHDTKVVTVRSDAEVIPYNNGLKTLTPTFVDFFVPVKITPNALLIPGTYAQYTLLRWAEVDDPKVGLASHHPETDGTTDRVISDKHSTKTSLGISVSPDVSQGLADKKVSVTGKLPVSFSFGREYIDEQTVQMTLKDYGVAFREKRGAGYAAATWEFSLANDIAGNRSYFNDSYLLGDARLTPMMRRANLQTIATWRVRGDYEGKLYVDSLAAVRNRWYRRENINLYTVNSHASVTELDDCDARVAYGETSACKLVGFSTTGSVPEFIANSAQPLASVEMDLSSPYLTRTPTVLLQSLKHPDRCLTHWGTTATLVACDRSPDERSLQWTFDEFGRYVNRASGACLQVSPASGRVVVQPCNQSLQQQWEWRADRIHSRFEGGTRQLRAPEEAGFFNGLTADYRPGIDPILPINPTNALLPPWTTYPLKAHKGDYIPGFNFTAAPLPDSYLGFDDVDDAVRWGTIPLVFGIE